MNSEFFYIGLFQLENLLINNFQFVLFDLRGEGAPELKPPKLLERSRRVKRESALNLAQEILAHKDEPLILICGKGEVSAALAKEMSEAGYKNVFVVEGGAERLISDWHSTTNA